MVYYLIVCRSLTYAQRTVSALERTGITAHLLRSPKIIAGEGCGYSVKVSERQPDCRSLYPGPGRAQSQARVYHRERWQL